MHMRTRDGLTTKACNRHVCVKWSCPLHIENAANHTTAHTTAHTCTWRTHTALVQDEVLIDGEKEMLKGARPSASTHQKTVLVTRLYV